MRPYAKSNKDDAKDTEAICEALSQPSMRFVAAFKGLFLPTALAERDTEDSCRPLDPACLVFLDAVAVQARDSETRRDWPFPNTFFCGVAK